MVIENINRLGVDMLLSWVSSHRKNITMTTWVITGLLGGYFLAGKGIWAWHYSWTIALTPIALMLWLVVAASLADQYLPQAFRRPVAIGMLAVGVSLVWYLFGWVLTAIAAVSSYCLLIRRWNTALFVYSVLAVMTVSGSATGGKSARQRAQDEHDIEEGERTILKSIDH